MTTLQVWILVPFGIVTAILVVCGFAWLPQAIKEQGSRLSFAELRVLAERSKFWFLIPFAPRTVNIWKYCSWLVGFAWLAAGLLQK